jgi:hypothetical protein
MLNRIALEFDFDGPTGLEVDADRTVERVLVIDLSGPDHLFPGPALINGFFDTEVVEEFVAAAEDEYGYLEVIESEDQHIVMWSDEILEENAEDYGEQWIKFLINLGYTCAEPRWVEVADYVAEL